MNFSYSEGQHSVECDNEKVKYDSELRIIFIPLSLNK